MLEVGPALAAGNTIVLKPAELTPLTAMQLERIALEAGLPEGVSTSSGPGTSSASGSSSTPTLAKVAFTGLDRGGPAIQALAAAVDQAGDARAGRDSANVSSRTPTSSAAASAPLAVFGNAGQDCCARSRILVDGVALDDFLGALGSCRGAPGR